MASVIPLITAKAVIGNRSSFPPSFIVSCSVLSFSITVVCCTFACQHDVSSYVTSDIKPDAAVTESAVNTAVSWFVLFSFRLSRETNRAKTFCRSVWIIHALKLKKMERNYCLTLSLQATCHSLHVICVHVDCYRQDAAKRQTAGIVFTHRPKIRFFAPQGWLVAPIQVKLRRTDGHLGPLGCAKFHVNRCEGVGMRPQKYQKFPLFW